MFQVRPRELGLAVLVLAAFYAGFAVIARVLTWGIGLLTSPGWEAAAGGLLAAAVPALVTALGIYAWLAQSHGWNRVRLRIPRGSRFAGSLALGLVWGVGLAALALALSFLGGAQLLLTTGPEPYWVVAVPAGIGLAFAALLEELLFRGFPLVRLADVTSRVVASVALTLLFVAAHWLNPAVSGMGFVNIGLASLLLSAVFFSSGGLPAAVGLHFGWNAGLVLLADAPVSGLQLRLPAVEYLPGPHGWWTGGRFGPEGGLAAAVVFGAALAWWWRRGFRAKEIAR